MQHDATCTAHRHCEARPGLNLECPPMERAVGAERVPRALRQRGVHLQHLDISDTSATSHHATPQLSVLLARTKTRLPANMC